MPREGTPRAVGPIADQVLAWVADQRKLAPYQTEYDGPVDPDDIRRIELCALAAREAAMFHELYGMETPDATAPQVQDER